MIWKMRILRTSNCKGDFMLHIDNRELRFYCRYKERAKQLYDKYCELLNEDAYCDRITHKKIRFNKSKYDCINKTIRKRYKNNNTFPTYYDIDKLIRKCVERNKLEISSTELERESKYYKKDFCLL